MNNKQTIEYIKEAVLDKSLSDGALRFVIYNTLFPTPVTKEIIEWANKKVKELKLEKEKL
jgi:hypothetical protein